MGLDKIFNIFVIRFIEGEKKESRTEKILEKVMAETSHPFAATTPFPAKTECSEFYSY